MGDETGLPVTVDQEATDDDAKEDDPEIIHFSNTQTLCQVTCSL